MDIRTYVTNRLRSFGVEVTDDDDFTVGFCIDRAEAEIRAQTNLTDFPGALFPTWADMAAGYFLAEKRAAGTLPDSFSAEPPAKSITEGDVSVTFAVSDTDNSSARLDALISKLTTPNNALFARYRRFVWSE